MACSRAICGTCSRRQLEDAPKPACCQPCNELVRRGLTGRGLSRSSSPIGCGASGGRGAHGRLAGRRRFGRHVHRHLPGRRGSRRASRLEGAVDARRSLARHRRRRRRGRSDRGQARQPADIAYFGHGTTVATNALIQHTRRQDRPDHHRRLPRPARDRPPAPPASLRPAVRQAADRWSRATCGIEVAERLRHDGRIETPLDEDGVRARGARAEGGGRQGGRDLLPLLLTSIPRTRRARQGDRASRSCPTSSSPRRTRWRRSSASSSGSRPRWSTPISGR